MIEAILAWLGFSDQIITKMGPSTTIALAVLIGSAFAQWIKYPLERQIADAELFNWTVRSLAMAATFVAAHFLSDTVSTAVEIGVAIGQPFLYHFTLSIIRKWWPWMETYSAVGAVNPPITADLSAMRRSVEKSGENSGT